MISFVNILVLTFRISSISLVAMVTIAKEPNFINKTVYH